MGMHYGQTFFVWGNNCAQAALSDLEKTEMRTLSHIMVTLSTLVLLLFGSGGIGWQRCACSGRVSLVTPAHQGCCKSGSKCMTVTIKHLSAADLQTDETSVPQLADNILFDNRELTAEVSATPLHIPPQSRHAYWYPPGWTATRGMVMRV